MITDKLLRVSENQAITGDEVSDNTIDLGLAGQTLVREIGEGKPLYMVFTITETFAKLTSLIFKIIADDDATLGSPTVLAATDAITLASGGLAAGKQYVLQIPPAIASLGLQYLGASYDVTGTSPDAGKVTTDIVETIQDGRKFYKSGFTVV